MFPSMRKTQREFIQRIYKMTNENRDWSNVPKAQETLLIFSRWSRQGIISFWSSPGRVSLLTYHLDCGKIANLIILVSAIRESNFIFPAIDLVLIKKNSQDTDILHFYILNIFSKCLFTYWVKSTSQITIEKWLSTKCVGLCVWDWRSR